MKNLVSDTKQNTGTSLKILVPVRPKSKFLSRDRDYFAEPYFIFNSRILLFYSFIYKHAAR
jgi:hypothetical protein